jgi:hypothetical protein
VRRVTALAVLLCMLAGWMVPPPVHAQFAVIDVAAIAQAVLSVQAALETIGLITSDLAALSSMGSVVALIQQIQRLSAQVENEARIIKAIATAWGARLDESRIPCTSEDLRLWNYDAAELARRSILSVTLMEALIEQTIEMLATLANIIALIASITGTTSGAQFNGGILAAMSAKLDDAHMKMAAFRTVMIGGEAIAHMNTLAMDCLARKRYADWGFMGR